MSTFFDRVVELFAEEVQRRMPKEAKADVTQETLVSNLNVLLQEADWFRALVRDTVQDSISFDGVVRDASGEAAERVRRQFDINDYRDEIESIAEEVLERTDISDMVKKEVEGYDFASIVEEVVGNHDFSGDVESAVADATQELLQQVETLASGVAELQKTQRVAMLPPEVEQIKQRVERHDRFLKTLASFAQKELDKPGGADGVG